MKKAACRGVWLIRGLTLLAILVLIAVATNRNWKLFSWLESRQYAAGVADFLIAVAGGVAVGFVAGWVVAPAGGLAPSGATGPLGLQDQQIEGARRSVAFRGRRGGRERPGSGARG